MSRCQGRLIMHFAQPLRALLFLALTATALAIPTNSDGTWTSTTNNATWSTFSNWSGNTIASGLGYTANFATVDVPASTTLTVNLGASRTIGNITWGDSNTLTSGGSWVLANGGTPAYVLTLASASSPTLTTNQLNVEISAIIAGTSGFTKAGSQTLTLSGANTYSGTTAITAGALTLKNTSALGTSSVTVASGTSLTYAASGTFTNNVTLAAGAHLVGGTSTSSGNLTLNGEADFRMFNSDAQVLSGVISGSYGFTRIGGGASGGSTLTFSGTSANTYTGTTTNNIGTLILAKTAGVTAVPGALAIAGGTVRLNAANQIADTSAVSIGDSAVLHLNDNNETIGSLASSLSTSSVTLGSGALTVGGDNTSTTFAGAITGTGSVTKIGAGNQTLSGANAHTGGTTVSAGTLTLGSATALSAATGTVAINGGRLATSVATTTVGSHITFTSGTLALNDTAAGSLILASAKTFTMSGGTLQLTLGTAFDQIVSAGLGTLSLTGGTINFDPTGAGFSYASSYQIFSGFSPASFSSLTLSGYDDVHYLAAISSTGQLSFASAIPEPSTYAALAGATALVLALYRRRSQPKGSS